MGKENAKETEVSRGNRFAFSMSDLPEERDDAEEQVLSDSASEDDNAPLPENVAEDDAEDPVKCLFCAEMLVPSAAVALAHTRDTHGFDILALVKQHHLDFYSCIRLINFVRASVAEGASVEDVVARASVPANFADARFMKPMLQSDAFLSFDFSNEDDDEEDSDDDEQGDFFARSSSFAAAPDALAQDLARENANLRQAVQELEQRAQNMSKMLQKLLEQGCSSSAAAAAAAAAAPAASTAEPKRISTNPPIASHVEQESGYFSTYGGRPIHEVMLKDRPRTLAYQDFFYKNPQLFQGKVVLDVGCGTGILSMFAAKSGARLVIGVDAADIIDKARDIVAANGLADRIVLLKGKLEEISLPAEVTHVDIIVSEWMGYFLLYESMMSTVLLARDRWLRKPSESLASSSSASASASESPSQVVGVYPNIATMFVSGIDCSAHYADRVAFWRDVYGFNMEVEGVKESQLVTTPETLYTMDLLTITDKLLDFEATVVLTANENLGADRYLDAFCVHFDTLFTHGCTTPVTLTTSPAAPLTHWAQTVFYLAHPLRLQAGDRVTVSLKASRPAHSPRTYQVAVSYALAPKGQPLVDLKQTASSSAGSSSAAALAASAVLAAPSGRPAALGDAGVVYFQHFSID